MQIGSQVHQDIIGCWPRKSLSELYDIASELDDIVSDNKRSGIFPWHLLHCQLWSIAFLFVGLHFCIFVFPNFRLFKVHENTEFLKIIFISISFWFCMVGNGFCSTVNVENPYPPCTFGLIGKALKIKLNPLGVFQLQNGTLRQEAVVIFCCSKIFFSCWKISTKKV